MLVASCVVITTTSGRGVAAVGFAETGKRIFQMLDAVQDLGCDEACKYIKSRVLRAYAVVWAASYRTYCLFQLLDALGSFLLQCPWSRSAALKGWKYGKSPLAPGKEWLLCFSTGTAAAVPVPTGVILRNGRHQQFTWEWLSAWLHAVQP